MTRTAGDAVIPHSRPGRWRSADSSVRTRVIRTGRPVAQLVLDALRYAQPVEVGKERSDVVVALRANCQACGSVHDGLQTVQVAAWQASESDVTVAHLVPNSGLRKFRFSISIVEMCYRLSSTN